MPVFRRGRPGGSEEHIGGKVLMDYQELTEIEAYVDLLRVQELEKAPRGPLPTEGTE